MKNLTHYSLLPIMLLSGFCYAQNKPTKSQITRLIKASIDQESKKSVTVGKSAWTICNQDSAFFKSDTIRLFSNANYFYQVSKCCSFIEWTFFKTDKFLQCELQTCVEPATRSAATDQYHLTIDKKGIFIVRPYKSSLLSNKFEISKTEKIKLANNNSSDVIVLVRLK